MSNEEFSNEFDVLYNNLTSNQAPGLDEYEKSVFLTKAQYEIQYAYADPRGNKFIQGFDGSPKRQADFSKLMKTAVLSPLDIENKNKFDSRSVCFYAPDDMFIPINELCSDTNYRYVVIGIDFGSYNTFMSKPYQYPPKRHIWRLFTQTKDVIEVGKEKQEVSTIADLLPDLEVPDLPTVQGKSVRKIVIELIGVFDKESLQYTIRYIKRARPIILTDLTDMKLTIDGESTKSTCELDEELHREILTRAVELAKAYYTGDLNTQIALGNSSATQMGVVPQSNNRE